MRTLWDHDIWAIPQFLLFWPASRLLSKNILQVLNSPFIWQAVLFFSDTSLIANYDVKRCYEVDVTFHYNIPGGLKPKTIDDTKNEFSKAFTTLSSLLSFSAIVPQCIGVNTNTEDITASPPGVTSVFFRVPLIFTAARSVPDDQVSLRLTNCINTVKTNYKGLLDQNTPSITEGNVTYSKYNLSTISDKTSCCGGDIPPPCCTAGSIKVSSTKCGKTSVSFLFLANFFKLSFSKVPISNVNSLNS